tara:strand:+ start:54 stop:707 length:654 start_codon:yes stop_codon:yes gene_type:complete
LIKNTTLFGFPVITTKINSKSYNKKSIISTIEKNFKLNKKRNQWDKISLLHHSYNDDTNSKYHKVDYSTLMPVYKKIITKILNNMNIHTSCDFKLTIANYTCLSESNYMASHIHPFTDFTAVHYIQFDKKNHTSTAFENVLPHIDYIHQLSPELPKILSNHSSNSWIYDTWKLDVKEDDFCFSPSFLKHKIEPQTSKNKNRITIVLNISLKKNQNHG